MSSNSQFASSTSRVTSSCQQTVISNRRFTSSNPTVKSLNQQV